MKASLPRFRYFPFGGSPRSCIGELFAWTEELLVIATIAMHWKMRLESGHPVILQPFVCCALNMEAYETRTQKIKIVQLTTKQMIAKTIIY